MTITTFQEADLAQLPALQPPDWGDLIPRFRYFLQSDFCFPVKISENGQLLAIGTNMHHTDSVWLACIVVHPAHRNKGLGKMITRHLIDQIDRKRYPTIYLDATEYGYPVYRKLGFELETCYSHLAREVKSETYPISTDIVRFEEKFREQVLRVDRQVSGEDRAGILQDFISTSYLYISDNLVLGYYVPEWGDAPVMAIDDRAGIELMKLRIQMEDKAIVPQDNLLALEFLAQNNFIEYKFSRRMFLGLKREWKADKLFNRISGQLG
ncbi:GNAT family N-acetyltransferase [Dyadobacter aurulentus]|uniref:GNAT family N-acetyltransferase n=1 Tax=Dyadobacter sp. UC 10 TaxID=2605428 RepID=UPI0011F20D55|nr:GNAT family N-acetyltransferase [Dyadobacter sp. UC 10]KAA0993113.1 GNAT family N-acetyltransferase [Dyadobacter sp. UC 10]